MFSHATPITPSPTTQPLYLGTQTLYEPGHKAYTPAPNGYEPFYINHLGRHGARYLTSSEKLDSMIDILKDAKCGNNLTPLGEQIYQKLEKLHQKEKGHFGLLSYKGVDMEKGIAKRMAQRFPQVFGKKVFAVSTYIMRTKESMHAFIGELSQYIPNRTIQTSSYGQIDPILRFFDLNKDYLHYKEKGVWKKILKDYEQRSPIANKVSERLLIDSTFLDNHAKLKFAAELYATYTNQFDIGCDVGLGKAFKEEELKYLWQNKNVSMYLEKGPSLKGINLPTDISFGLLENFLTSSEEAIQKQDISANLRFAHAETIVPFASLLGIQFASEQVSKASEINAIWKNNIVAPMAANIQWVFYKNKDNKVLVKMLYNENEIDFPIMSEFPPYYKWSDIKEFYNKKLQQLNIPKNTSLVESVTNYEPTPK